jgi:hypothetical protein
MSKNNWLKAINDINKSRYTIPEGWDTKEQVAEKMQCSPDRVADLLKPGIQSGDFERQEFSVWNEARRMTERVTCYRIAGDKREPKGSPECDDKERERVIRGLKRDPSKSNHLVAKNNRSTSARVAAIRKELGL